MKSNDPLLDELMPGTAALREVTRAQVRRLARRRHRGRMVRRVGAGCALLLVAGMFFFPRDGGKSPPEGAGLVVVRSQPLGAEERVTTRRDLFAPVESGLGGWAVVTTRAVDIRITETRLAMPALDYLDDRGLLAALLGGRAALIDAGTERARVVFY